MLKILQVRLQKYMNCELPEVQAGFRNGRGTRDQIANIRQIIEKAREFQKNIYFCFIDYAKAFDCVDHNKLLKILKEMGIPDHVTCFLRNLLAGQEATVRTGYGTTDWFQIGKGVCQDCSSREELKSLSMKVKEESQKVGLKFNIQKPKIMASCLITSWQIDGETLETLADLFWGTPKSLQMVTAAMKLKDAYSMEGKYGQPRQHIKKQRHYFANKGPSSQGFSSGHVRM